jgi:hypothetical protein
MVDSDVGRKGRRWNSIATWYAQQYTCRRVEGEKIHIGGGGGKYRVETQGAGRTNSTEERAVA